MSKKPIGIFDSGIGGTSIWNAINNLLPNENTIYLADSANAPYGAKGKDAIINLSIKNTEYLIQNNSKLIVVACNTATTNAISILRKRYNIPFIGIEPAIKPAALQSKTHTIGILATKGTLTSDLFSKTSNLFTNDINVIEQIGDGIVELIESGNLYSKTMKTLLETYLEPMIASNIDYLVLGCTHYPYVVPLIKEILPENVKIIDSGEAVARQTKKVLENTNLLNTTTLKPQYKFYTNGKTSVMESVLNYRFNVKYLNF